MLQQNQVFFFAAYSGVSGTSGASGDSLLQDEFAYENITVLERAEQLMGRVIPLKIANLIQEKHESMGTKINLNVEIKNIEQKNDAFTIHYNNETLLSDLIIIGVGSKPNTEIFQNTSLKIDNGILTDEFSATSIEDVFAAGDVSSFYHPFYQDHMRLESYKHAQNHGINAGKNLIGLKTSYSEIPWMWSDQFNLNLQLTGICNDYETSVQRGSTLENGIIYFFLKSSDTQMRLWQIRVGLVFLPILTNPSFRLGRHFFLRRD